MIISRKDCILSSKELAEQKIWRRWKYGSAWLSAGDKELKFRYANQVPLELGYREAREWLIKK